jgi:SAM-dependent methyltransferase
MHEPEFDRYADQYDALLGKAIPGALDEEGYFAEYKVVRMARQLAGKTTARILDFGCGAGRSLHYLEQHFPDSEIWGFDLSPASLEIAARRVPRARLASDWSALTTTRFDAVLAANVFHHIPPDEQVGALARCRDVLAPGGQLFVFEHNPWNPLTRWVFERCAFDVDAKMLSLRDMLALARRAGFSRTGHAYALFFPKQLSALRPLERILGWLPLGGQYVVRMAR